jgi:hypothetical protein
MQYDIDNSLRGFDVPASDRCRRTGIHDGSGWGNYP